VPLIRAAEAFEAAHDARAPSIVTTAVANIVLATAFALLLGAAMMLRPATGWRAGLLWGLAGYVAFFVAPSIGLPPELPGTESAALNERQLWWAAAAACTAAGLWIAVFARSPAVRLAGILLLAAPHLAGAPHPPVHQASAPPELQAAFVRATYLANAIFWLALGALAGLFNRDAPSSPPNRSAAPLP
jgi:cobalt transporter subunit CbtA